MSVANKFLDPTSADSSRAYEVVPGPWPVRFALAPDAPGTLGANDDAVGALVLGIASLIATPIFVFAIVALLYARRGVTTAASLQIGGFYPSGRAISVAGAIIAAIALLEGVVIWIVALATLVRG